MTDRSHALTPDALVMLDAIGRTGSFAAAARELGKVPSALTYSVRQLEETLDVLLFDRSSRQARFTAAGEELLAEGRRLLIEVGALAQRVRRVAMGWEGVLSVTVDDIISMPTLLDLCESFYALDLQGRATEADGRSGPGTQLRLRSSVLAGTWEALTTGQADLAIGVGQTQNAPPGIALQTLGTVRFVFVVAPHHPLAQRTQALCDADVQRYRVVAVADSAQRLNPVTVNIQPGQEVLTVASMRAKTQALLRGLGCGYMPESMVREHLEAGQLRALPTQRGEQNVTLGYAWRAPPRGARVAGGLALQWWLKSLSHEATRRALLERF